MTITNETILKAAKAAGLYCFECRVLNKHVRLVIPNGIDRPFNPFHDDTDNAMIRRGAEIDITYVGYGERMQVLADDRNTSCIYIGVASSNKAKAEREAVILCAAAKWDAQGEKA